MRTLRERLTAGELLLIDGATGTDIERRGVPMTPHAWCGGAHLTHPDDVRAVHIAHIDAGAEVIVANTYASSRHVLAQAGMADHFEELNRSGVQLALEARALSNRPDVVVAGSISTTEQGGEQPSIDDAVANYTEQAQILAAAGAELIILEMMREAEHTRCALDAAVATGLPVWLGVSCVVKDGVPWLWRETVTLEDFLPTISRDPIDVLAVMHTEVDDIDVCLDVVDQGWTGPVGVYAQSGVFNPPVWEFIDTVSPEDYAAACLRWIDRGVQVIGGCCGVGHEHIAHLRPIIDAAQPTS